MTPNFTPQLKQMVTRLGIARHSLYSTAEQLVLQSEKGVVPTPIQVISMKKNLQTITNISKKIAHEASEGRGLETKG